MANETLQFPKDLSTIPNPFTVKVIANGIQAYDATDWANSASNAKFEILPKDTIVEISGVMQRKDGAKAWRTTKKGQAIALAQDGLIRSSFALVSQAGWVDKNGNAVDSPLDKIKEVGGKSLKTIQIAGSIGLLGGLGFAYYRKSGVGGYIGWGLLGSAVLSIGAAIMVGRKLKNDLLGGMQSATSSANGMNWDNLKKGAITNMVILLKASGSNPTDADKAKMSKQLDDKMQKLKDSFNKLSPDTQKALASIFDDISKNLTETMDVNKYTAYMADLQAKTLKKYPNLKNSEMESFMMDVNS